MEQVFKYSIPVLHPIVVHFSIVLVPLAAATIMVWLFRDRMVWLTAGIFIQVLGFIGSLTAFLTGEEMEEQSEGVPIVEELVHTHEDAALLSIWIIGITLAAMIGIYFFTRSDTTRPGTPAWMRFLLAVLCILGASAIAWTGHIGGTMVWGVIP